tara:strand:- start:153 stop:749 length:597 start_codon:yes stop_codon:yes gene_type:complete
MKSVKVIDEFLPREIFIPHANGLMQQSIYAPINFTIDTEKERDGSIVNFGELLYPEAPKFNFQFQAVLYRHRNDKAVISDVWFDLKLFFDELKKKLQINQLKVARINCNTVADKQYEGEYHTDYDISIQQDMPFFFTAILYFNSNNGGTRFENGQFVQSKANRCVIFPTEMKHCTVWQTDAKMRFVLNLNYFVDNFDD